MTQTDIARSTTEILDFEIITDKQVSHRSHDFVEIEPVRQAGDAFETLFGEEARSPVTTKASPGHLALDKNPHYVEGAYENLRHHQARSELRDLGLSTEPGVTHYVPLAATAELPFLVDFETDGSGAVQTGLAVTQIHRAARAGAAHGATHIRVRIR